MQRLRSTANRYMYHGVGLLTGSQLRMRMIKIVLNIMWARGLILCLSKQLSKQLRDDRKVNQGEQARVLGT